MVEFRKDTIVLVKDLERSPQLISRECRLIGSTQIHLKLLASRWIFVQEVQIDSFGKHAAHVCAHHNRPAATRKRNRVHAGSIESSCCRSGSSDKQNRPMLRVVIAMRLRRSQRKIPVGDSSAVDAASGDSEK